MGIVGACVMGLKVGMNYYTVYFLTHFEMNASLKNHVALLEVNPSSACRGQN